MYDVFALSCPSGGAHCYEVRAEVRTDGLTASVFCGHEGATNLELNRRAWLGRIQFARDVVAMLRGHGVVDICERQLNIPLMRQRAESIETAS